MTTPGRDLRERANHMHGTVELDGVPGYWVRESEVPLVYRRKWIPAAGTTLGDKWASTMILEREPGRWFRKWKLTLVGACGWDHHETFYGTSPAHAHRCAQSAYADV